MDRITAVLALWKNLELTVEFVDSFRIKFPDVPLTLSVLGNDEEYQKTVKEKYGSLSNVKVLYGSVGTRVSFSENWDAAINAVQTERFVFLHNDMYIHKDFFTNLNKAMDELGPESFYLYTTVEPLKCSGFVRPGKIVAPFGDDLDEFKELEFNEFAEKRIRETENQKYINGYGFYLAGFTESLHKVGGFDFHTFYPVFCEDDDISLRIRLAKFRVKVVYGALVYHFGSKTIRTEFDTGMSALEIESNRKFARKWGFEARYLWETGYENMPDDKLSIGTEKIKYTYTGVFANNGFVPSYIDVINVEPLVDCLTLDSKVDTQDYFKGELNSRLEPVDSDADIVITQDGPSDFNLLANLIGTLRFGHRRLKVGHSRVGSYEIDILKVKPDQSRVDTVNYLLEQKSKLYD